MPGISKLVVWCVGLCLLCNMVTAGEIRTVLGTGKSSNNGDAGKAVQLNIGQPFGVEIGPEGALYATEISNHRIFRVDLATEKATVVAGSGKAGYSGDGESALKGKLNEPYEVRFDSLGNMYFVEMQNHLIRRVDAQTGTLSTVAGTGKRGYGGDGGAAARATFNRPHSITLDGRGGIYVADIGNHRIRRIDVPTGRIETIAGNGAKQLPIDGQKAKGSPVLGPRALYVEGSTLWVALREGNSIWTLDLSSGLWGHVAGTGKKGYSGDGGPAAKATFNGPKGIAVDGESVLVVDTENQVIRRIDRSTNMIFTVAGTGPKGRGFNGDKPKASNAWLGRPHGICIGTRPNSAFIGDTENHRVRRIQWE